MHIVLTLLLLQEPPELQGVFHWKLVQVVQVLPIFVVVAFRFTGFRRLSELFLYNS